MRLVSQRLDEDDKALQALAEILCTGFGKLLQHFDVEMLELQGKRLAWPFLHLCWPREWQGRS